MRKTAVALVMALGSSMLAGCAGAPSTPPGSATPSSARVAHTHDPTSHNHDRGHMMIASNGVVDALLTSHLSSRDGNELDVFVEKNGAPLALGTTTIEATALVRGARGGDPTERTLRFSCAPPDERPPGEAEGTCSHFVARAAWMTQNDRLEVATSLPLLSGDVVYRWRSFDPRRYAHHVE